MNDEIKSVQDDLAFLRTLTEGRGDAGMGAAGGALYAGAGLVYGLQCLGHFGQVIGVLRLPPLGSLLLGWLPTVIFAIMMTVVIVIDRRRPTGGVANRAVNSAFAGAGIANLALILIFAAAALRNHDFRYWLFHPAVVFVLQGAVWYVVFVLRKRMWMALVAAGWIGSGVALGLLIDHPGPYLLVAGLGLFAWMMTPGYVLMRQALRQTARAA
ncbi:hypothetical protein [Caulobacter sp. LARHSG274]